MINNFLKPKLQRLSICDFFCGITSSYVYTKKSHKYMLNIYGVKLFANEYSAKELKITLYGFVRI